MDQEKKPKKTPANAITTVVEKVTFARKMRKLLVKLLRRRFLKKHMFPTTTYIHREKGGIVFEVELNWYDEDLMPVTLVREVKTGKTYSIRYEEMVFYVELRGNSHTDGISIE